MTALLPQISPTALRSVIRPSIKDVRSIFPSATGAGIILPQLGQGLVIVFNQQADLCRELNIGHPSSEITQTALFDLTRQFGFVVLKNCKATSIPMAEKVVLSRGTDSDGKFLQDPYHYDVPPENFDLPQSCYMTGIYKMLPEEREEDTIHVLESDVKLAIPKLDMSDLNDDVIDALHEMERPDYHFRLNHPDEKEARQIVRLQYPDFVEDIYNLVPEGRKYRQRWLKDQWDILVTANVFGDWVHARPTGHIMTSHESPFNPLGSFYLFRNVIDV